MLIAIISDIHANLEALETCLRKIDEIKPDKLISLGDLVDYCAQPNECIELVRQRADVNLLGNHDEAQINYSIASSFTENAYVSSVHTRSVIKPQHIEYFKTLPRTYSLDDMFFVHASPLNPAVYDYVVDIEDAMNNFRGFGERICFIGHSHKPIIFEQSGDEIGIAEPDEISPDKRYIINVGSVGQPRDGDYRLCFGLFDMERFRFEYVRIDYPREIASKKIIVEGLPAYLAERILVGE